MRGGNSLCLFLELGEVGLSPHARGKQVMQIGARKFGGPIPACAGETLDHKSLIQKEISRFASCF